MGFPADEHIELVFGDGFALEQLRAECDSYDYLGAARGHELRELR